MKILNLYACLGGNRYKWDEVADIDVTAVELDEEAARLYQERFPNDKVIVADAHQYLLEHYKEFDFIWSSPPCPTHSRTNYFTQVLRKIPKYPDMQLYEEIIFLSNFYKGKFCIENVISYYEPLIKPKKIGRHYFWTNFNLNNIQVNDTGIGTMMKEYRGKKNHALNKTLNERNAVNSDIGKTILETALGIISKQNNKQSTLNF